MNDGQSWFRKSTTSDSVPDVQKLARKPGEAALRGLGSVRLSHETDETTSPVRQTRAIEAEAKELEVELVGWASDLNVSAAEVEPFSRPELGPWLTDRADEWDVIFFAKQDRAARSQTDMSKLLTFCKEHQKVMVVVEPPGNALYDFREGYEQDPMVSMFAQLGAQFFAFASELEVHNIKQRVKSMRRYLRENGEWGGGRFPFGYEPQRIPGQKRGSRLVVHEETAEIVRDIVHRVVDEKDPLLKVAEDLSADGVPTPFDYWDAKLRADRPRKRTLPRTWSVTALGKMLRSRALLGESEFEGKLVLNEEQEPVLRAEKPLISIERWNSLQEAMADLRLDKVRYSQESETLGVAFCGDCGGPLYAKESTAKGRTYSHLVCRYRQKQYGGTCSHPAISKNSVELVLRDTFVTLIGDTPFMRRRYVPGDDRSEELAKVVHLRKSLQRERDLGFQEDDEEYFERLKFLTDRVKDLSATPVRKAGYVWEQTGQTYVEAWESFTPAARRKILAALGIKIYVGQPDRFTAGQQAWNEFTDNPENSSLPGNRWFAGAALSADDVDRIISQDAGERFDDEVSSCRRLPEATLRRQYKTKPLQMTMIRSGPESVDVQLRKAVEALKPKELTRNE